MTDKMTTTPDVLAEPLAHDFLNMVWHAALGVLSVMLIVALVLHLTNLRGTFAISFIPPGLLGFAVGDPRTALIWTAGCVLGGIARELRRADEIKKGGDKARKQRNSRGMIKAFINWRDRRNVWRDPLVRKGAYPLGEDRKGAVVRLPLGIDAGKHSLIIGATGSGKTTTVYGSIEANLSVDHGVVVIDPKGDRELVRALRTRAFDLGRPFWQFSLDGESDLWNPLANGTPTEVADKLIGAEEWTEPHYKRLYQRYLLAVCTAIRTNGDTPTLAKVVDLLYPDRLALYVRDLPNDVGAERLSLYLGAMTADETRDLAGLRNRLAILAEGEHGHLFEPGDLDPRAIDLYAAISQGAVVVFSLNSNSSPETAKLIGAAIFQDLKYVAGLLEATPEHQRPAAVIVDEFGAFGADHVLGLFQRARSAKLSLTLLTQELADLQSVSPAFRDQVLGNVETIIAHRQNVPESAELVAELAGTQEVWIYTFQTDDHWHNTPADRSGLGSKRRGHEFHIGPDTIKALRTGEAVVITKNPHDVRHVRVYTTTGRFWATDTPFPWVEQRMRVAVYQRAYPERAHEWAPDLYEQRQHEQEHQA